ncbi:MAG: glycosyltransferase [Acidimicrobiia bacterium]|nr:glycosyltransferase [Acidimicrobiia bacterium]
MRVLFVQGQPCIRTLKYASALAEHHPEIRLAFAHQGLTLDAFYGEGDELFERWFPIPVEGARPALEAAIDRWRPDIIHHHNLPDTLAVTAIGLVDGAIPVIHDVHDMWSLRRTEYEDGLPEAVDPATDEKRAVENASAIVAISSQMAREIRTLHDTRSEILIYANYATQVGPPPAPNPRDRRLVYEGTLTTNNGHYDLRSILRTLGHRGLDVDIYSRRPTASYRSLGPRVRVRPSLTPSGLMHALGRYGWGWAGFNSSLNGRHLDTALPNKAFEYVACGVPFVCLPHAALAEMAREWGVGLVVDQPEDVGEAIAGADRKALAEAAVEAREKATVGANIGRLRALYERLSGK